MSDEPEPVTTDAGYTATVIRISGWRYNERSGKVTRLSQHRVRRTLRRISRQPGPRPLPINGAVYRRRRKGRRG